MDYCPERTFAAEDFIQTSTGNIISRRATIRDPRTLEIPSGKCFVDEGSVLCTDIAPVQLNRYCFIGKNVQLKPCQSLKEPIINIKMTIGANTIVGDGCEIEAARIGAGCNIGRNVKIGPRCILKDYVRVLDDSVILADQVFPPFAIVAGNPAEIVGEQPESTSTLVAIGADDRYKALTPVKAT